MLVRAVLALALVGWLASAAHADDPALEKVRKAFEDFQLLDAAKALDELEPTVERCAPVGELMLSVPLAHPLYDDLDQKKTEQGRVGQLTRNLLGAAFTSFVDRATKKLGVDGATVLCRCCSVAEFADHSPTSTRSSPSSGSSRP